MKLNFALVALLAFASAGVQAQNGSSLVASGIPHRQFRSMQTAASPSASRASAEPEGPTMKERVQSIEGTLGKMHAVLDRMRSRAGAVSKDPLAKANLDMWQLMVAHLDDELKELRVSMALREQWEARRAAMYKQADAKIQAEAQAAQQKPSQDAPSGTSNQSAPPSQNPSPSPR